MAQAKPAKTEYAEYYEKYVSLVPGGNIVDTLESQKLDTVNLLRGLTNEQGESRYAPDKWSIKELVGHVIDTERIFAYRALRFARGDKNELTGFDQDPYVRNGNFQNRSLNDLISEFEHVRSGNILMLRSFDDAAWERRGIASENEVSVRALAYIMAGHELHHVGILRTRYLSK
jgi:DinB family protein